jgi:hypothetical protein
MLHWKTLCPTGNPATGEVASEAFKMVPPPLRSVQLPDPVVGKLPERFTPAEQTVWLTPALAVVGAASRFTTYVAVEGLQLPLLMDH